MVVRRRVHMPMVATCVLAAACLVAGAGCHKALFPKDEPRTQFEMHDRMRGGYTPLEEPDVFGNPRPNLRSRLGEQQ